MASTEKDQNETSETSDTSEDVSRMTFTGHLGELRTRLIRSFVAMFVCFFICYAFSNTIIDAISNPLRGTNDENVVTTQTTESGNPGETSGETPVASESAKTTSRFKPQSVKWITLTPLEIILVKLRFSAYGAVLLSFPYIVYHICAFIFPGLKPSERRLVRYLLFGCSALAVAGALIAFFGVFPLVLPYLMSFTPDFVETQLRLSDTLSLILKGVMGFAIAFQFPMVVLILVYMGVLTPEMLKNHRRVAIVGLFVIGAILTPPDPVSLLLMALPLVLLYEFSIWASYIMVRRKRAKAGI